MKRLLAHAGIAVLFVGSSVVYSQEHDSVVKAWVDAGAKLGWQTQHQDQPGGLGFGEQRPSAPFAIPVFIWQRFPEPGLISKLPAPEAAFGMRFDYQGELNAENLKEVARQRNLISVYIRTKVTAASLNELAQLPNLQILEIRHDSIATAMKGLSELKSIRNLVLQARPVTDDGLKHLASLDQLEHLDLSFTKVTDDGLVELAKFRKLQSLRLTFLPITQVGLSHIRGLTGLRCLDLFGCEVTDSGMKEIVGFTNLEHLDLRDNLIRFPRHLSGFTKLRYLDLGGCPLNRESFEPLLELKNLQVLKLGRTRSVFGIRLDIISKLESLQLLDLSYSEIEHTTFNELSRLPNLRTLDLDDANLQRDGNALPITDESLNSLVHLRSTGTAIYLGRTGVTQAGVQKLRKARPDLKIHFGPF